MAGVPLRSATSQWKGVLLRRFDSTLSFGLLVAAVAFLGFRIHGDGHVLSGDDLVNYFLPTATFARGWVRQGILPLWNPMTFCGWPLVGDAQLRWLYPPNLLLTAFNPVFMFSIAMIANIGFGAAGMWFYLRRAAGVGPWPALCGAATFGLSGFMVNHTMSGIVVFPATGAWVPWIMLFGWQAGRGGKSPGTIALLAFSIGAQVFSGAPQIVFYTWIALFLQMLWIIGASIASRYGRDDRSLSRLAAPGKTLLRFGVGVALGMALGASSILPAAEFGALSFQRGGKARWESVTDCSLAPRYRWLMVAPKFFGDPHIPAAYWGGQEGYWDICGYGGIGPLAVLPLAGLWIGLGWYRRAMGLRAADKDGEGGQGSISKLSFASFHLLLAVAAFSLAGGKYSLVFRWLYDWIPGFDRFRVPGRWLLFWEFGLAALFAIMLDKLLPLKIVPTLQSGGPATNSGPLKWALRASWEKSGVAVAGLVAALLVLAALSSAELVKTWGITQFYPDFNPSSGRFLDLQLQNWAMGSLGRAAALAAGWAVVVAIATMNTVGFRRRAVPALAALLVLADVLTFATWMPVTRTPIEQTREFYQRSLLVELLAKASEGHRSLAIDDVHAYWNDQNQPELWADRAMVHGLNDARGYYPLCLRWFGQFINVMCGRPASFPMGGLLIIDKTLNPSLLSMLDVKSLLSYDNPPVEGLRPVHQTDFALRIFEVQGRMGPAYMRHSVAAKDMTDEEAVALLAGPGFDAGKFALAAGPIPEWKSSPKTGDPSSVEYLRPSPNHIQANIVAITADLLVVSESYHPGWKATIDGQKTDVVRANHAFLGVYVPPGEHRVDLHFGPESFRAGLYATLAASGILVALLVVAAGRRGDRRRKSPGRN